MRDFISAEVERGTDLRMLRRCRCSRFSSVSMRANAGLPRSASVTTIRCVASKRLRQFRRGSNRSRKKLRHSAVPRRASGRFYAPNTTPASASAGIAISRIRKYLWPVAGLGRAVSASGASFGRYMAALHTPGRTPLDLRDVGRFPEPMGSTASRRSKPRVIRSPSGPWRIDSNGRGRKRRSSLRNYRVRKHPYSGNLHLNDVAALEPHRRDLIDAGSRRRPASRSDHPVRAWSTATDS